MWSEERWLLARNRHQQFAHRIEKLKWVSVVRWSMRSSTTDLRDDMSRIQIVTQIRCFYVVTRRITRWSVRKISSPNPSWLSPVYISPTLNMQHRLLLEISCGKMFTKIIPLWLSREHISASLHIFQIIYSHLPPRICSIYQIDSTQSDNSDDKTLLPFMVGGWVNPSAPAVLCSLRRSIFSMTSDSEGGLVCICTATCLY